MDTLANRLNIYYSGLKDGKSMFKHALSNSHLARSKTPLVHTVANYFCLKMIMIRLL